MPATNSNKLTQFQSTPLREGRQNTREMTQALECFNPRPCVRGDISAVLAAYIKRVSIHAPA